MEILDQAIWESRVSIVVDADGNATLEGWAGDPFGHIALQPGRFGGRAEDERYHEPVPEHPLSVVRRTLRRLHPSIRLAQQIRAAPPIEYPARAAQLRWWKFW